MSCLTTFTEESKEDLNDKDTYLIPIVTEIDDKLHGILETLQLMQETMTLMDARIRALETAP